MKYAKLTLLALVVALPGCALSPFTKTSLARDAGDAARLEQQAADELQKQPGIVKVKLGKDAMLLAEPVIALPAAKDIAIDVDFSGASFEHVIYSVAHSAGLNVLFQRNGSDPAVAADSKAAPVVSQAKKPITIAFSGKLSDFLNLLSQSSGYFLQYGHAGIVVKEVDSFNLGVPSYPDLLKEVEANLKALGATSIAYDRLSSSLSFTADAVVHKRVRVFCESLRNNASLVSMRIMLMNVKLNGDKNAGIDWSKMIYAAGSQRAVKAFGQRTDSGLSLTTTAPITDPATGAVTPGSVDFSGAPIDMSTFTALSGQALVMNSTGANLFLEAGRVSLSALFNFIDTYGSYKIMQNVSVLAMSGTKGRLDVLTETPYVSEISLSALSNQAATATQSVKTEKAKSGVEMDILPQYNKQEGVLTMALKISVLGVTRFLSLEAGQLIGRITQPETTRKSIETYLRMSPYQTAVIGGLVYDKNSNTATGLPGETLATKAYNSNEDREELVVVVRPTVIEFEF